MVYRLDKEGNQLVELEETTFPKEKIIEPIHIEEWIRKNPQLLCDKDENIKIISKQQIYETRKRSDLVAIDDAGRIVIIEIKRDIAESMTEFQGIRYASSYLYSSYDEICRLYAQYLKDNKDEFGLEEGQDFLAEARREIENLCGEDAADTFNKNQRIILVSRDFSPDLISAVQWLILKGIDIKCIALTPYKDSQGLLIVPQVILPTPEISENIVRVRQAEEKVEQERQRAKYQPWEGSVEDHYNRLKPPLGEYLKRFVDELRVESSGLSGSGFHLVNGDRKIMVSTWVKSKIEFRFPKATKGDLEAILQKLGIASLTVKEKSDIEAYGLANPTPSIDYKEGTTDFEDIIILGKSWLAINE